MSESSFIERVAALVGRTTYREPCGGRSTGVRLTEQDVAAALSYGRLRRRGLPDMTDIGPEVAIGMACQIRHKKPDVTSNVEQAIRAEIGGKWVRVALAVNAAYEDLVMMLPTKRPTQIPEREWQTYYSIAFGTMINAATCALDRAERALYKASA